MIRWFTSFTLFNILVLLLISLLSKDPFSGLNPISELEPSPDAIHYLSPVKSVIEGHGFAISYQERSIPTLVPPLYSLTIIPFYSIFHDVRSFYFLNIGLIILSAYIFLKVILAVFSNRLIKILVFLGFCTNFILFWYPSFPMAENLLIFLTTISYLLLIPQASSSEFSKKKAAALGLIASLMYVTKYVAWVQGLGFLLSSLGLIWFTKSDKTTKIKLTGLSLGTLAGILFLSTLFETFTKGSGILSKINSNLVVVWHLVSRSSGSSGVVEQSSLFYRAPFWDNLTRYLFGLMGGPVTIAGQEFTIVPPVIGMIALLSPIMLYFITTAQRWLLVYITASILGTLIYLSAFQTVDARYFFAFIPGLILLFGFTLQGLVNFFYELHCEYYSRIILTVATLAVLGFSILPLTQGLKINWTHSDASQNFRTISTMNNYFANHYFAKKPTVAIILSPYQIDFFSNHTYELLPLSKIQYFTKSETQTWGIPVNLKYQDIYRSYLAQGKPLFVSTYHTNKDFVFWRDFQAVIQNFQLTKVADGCNGECDLFQIDSPRTNPPY